MNEKLSKMSSFIGRDFAVCPKVHRILLGSGSALFCFSKSKQNRLFIGRLGWIKM